MSTAITELQQDPDIIEEARTLVQYEASNAAESTQGIPSFRPRSTRTDVHTEPRPYRYIPLNMEGNSFQGNALSAELLREIGGGDVVRRIVDIFYKKAFVDPHLDQFIASHNDPHHTRLGKWIVEKMGGEGNVWTQERATRRECPVTLADGRQHVVHDRTSAHSAAWHCPKRATHLVGERFQLHDSRVWMRLMFWSARETGVFAISPTFEDWYVRFIAHFVKVYERSAPAFARESARWSLDRNNIDNYLKNGNQMGEDVMGSDGLGVSLRTALAHIPQQESRDSFWPYHVEDK